MQAHVDRCQKVSRQKGGIKMCIQCDNPRAKMRGTLLCEDCLTNTAKSLKSKLRDVETFDEDRREFLLRKNKELNIGHTEKEIISMIDRSEERRVGKEYVRKQET